MNYQYLNFYFFNVNKDNINVNYSQFLDWQFYVQLFKKYIKEGRIFYVHVLYTYMRYVYNLHIHIFIVRFFH